MFAVQITGPRKIRSAKRKPKILSDFLLTQLRTTATSFIKAAFNQLYNKF